VGLVEEAGTIQKVSEARTLETMLAPSYLGRGATPGLPLEHRPVALGEFPVETGVVCDDNHRILDECRNGSIVDPLSRNHFRRNAGEGGHIRWDGARFQLGRWAQY
jgi:hypothetical protein